MSSGACFVLILDFRVLRPFGPGRQICAQVFEGGIRPCHFTACAISAPVSAAVHLPNIWDSMDGAYPISLQETITVLPERSYLSLLTAFLPGSGHRSTGTPGGVLRRVYHLALPNRPRAMRLPSSRPTVLAAELMVFSSGLWRLEVLRGAGRRDWASLRSHSCSRRCCCSPLAAAGSSPGALSSPWRTFSPPPTPFPTATI